MSIKYKNRPFNGPTVHKIYQHLPLQDPPKFTQIWIFGLKTNHLATLLPAFVGFLGMGVCLQLVVCTFAQLKMVQGTFSGSPDGIFTYQKSHFRNILEGIEWCILKPFAIFMAFWCIFGQLA
jgi:hypothetical protein